MEKLLKEKSIIKTPIIDKCYNCNNKEIIPMKKFEHDFGDKKEIHDGSFCPSCKCFHFFVDNQLTYEYVYNDIFTGKEEVNWKISDN